MEAVVPSRPVSILLIEARPADAQQVETLLTEAFGPSVLVRHVGSLQGGVDVLAAQPCGLVLFGHGFPGTQHLDALRQLQAAAPTVPIVILSDLDDDAVALQALQAGAQDYLVKGRGSAETFRRIVRYAMERAELLRRERTARAEAEAASVLLERAQERLRFLADASAILAESLEYAQTLQRVVDLTVPQMADLCALVIGSSGALPELQILRHVDQANEPAFLRLAERQAANLHRASGLGHVLQTGESVLVPQVTDDLLQQFAVDADDLAGLRHLGFTSYLMVPLVARDRRFGALVLATSASGRHFYQDDLTLAELVARRVAMALDNARLHRDLQNALRARERLFTSVVHDLSNPLASLRLTTEVLREEYQEASQEGQQTAIALPPSWARRLAQLERSAVRMGRLLQEALDIARLEAGQQLPLQAQPTDLVALVREHLGDKEGGNAQQVLRLETSHTSLVGHWDAERLHRVLDNLVSNACKYSPAGAEVVLSVTREQNADSSWALLEVADQGIGIPADDLPHIFESFYRGRNVEPAMVGIGLGLWGSRHIVEQHGGTMRVESVEDQGTKVTVRLPQISETQASLG